MTKLAAHFGTISLSILVDLYPDLSTIQVIRGLTSICGVTCVAIFQCLSRNPKTQSRLCRKPCSGKGGRLSSVFFQKHGTFDLRKICLIFLFVLLLLAASKLKILIPMWCSFRMCTAGDGISQEVESGPHRPHCFGMPRCTKRFWSDSGDKQQQRIRMVRHQPFDCCICLGMFGVFRDTHVNYRINFDLEFTHTHNYDILYGI